jgi:predicted transglutaminase-like protease
MYFIFEMFYTEKSKNPELAAFCKITDERERYILEKNMARTFSFYRYNSFVSYDISEYKKNSFAKVVSESESDRWMNN